MFINQVFTSLRDSCRVCGQTPCNCTHIREGAYEDGVSDGMRGEPNRRASSIYGPETRQYEKGYATGLEKGRQQRDAGVAQAQADSAPYEQMSAEELLKLRREIQQRTKERQAIYTKLRGADYSFDFKRHTPPNHNELKQQGEQDNKAWHIINSVLQGRGVNIDKLGEGAAFGSRYAEQLAQEVFDHNPNIDDENQVLNLGYNISKSDLGSRAQGIFRDEDFPSDFVSAYFYLKKQGVAEGLEESNHWHEAGVRDASRGMKPNPRTYLPTMTDKKAKHPEEISHYMTGYKSVKNKNAVKEQGVAEGLDRLDSFTRKVLNRMEDDSWLSAERAYFIQKGAQEKAQRNREQYNQEIQRFIDLYKQYKGQLGVNEVSDATLTSYLTKVDADSQKHDRDPTKRSPKKRNRSVAGFARAFNKLDARREKTSESAVNRLLTDFKKSLK